MRTFIQYDGDGEVIAVVQTESLPQGLEHPFYLEDETHGVLELSEGDAAARRPGSELGQSFKVDVARRRLVEKSAPKRTPGEAIKQEAATTAAATKDATTKAAVTTIAEATKAAATNAVTDDSATKAATKKTATKKTGTKRTGTKKAATKKATTKAATRKGGRSSGSK